MVTLAEGVLVGNLRIWFFFRVWLSPVLLVFTHVTPQNLYYQSSHLFKCCSDKLREVSWIQNVKVIGNEAGLVQDKCTLLAKYPSRWVVFMLQSTMFLGLRKKSIFPSFPHRGSWPTSSRALSSQELFMY